MPGYRSNDIVCVCARYMILKFIKLRIIAMHVLPPAASHNSVGYKGTFLLARNQSGRFIIIGPRVFRLYSYRSGISDMKKAEFRFIIHILYRASFLEAICNLVVLVTSYVDPSGRAV
jgi:hypothetical protein